MARATTEQTTTVKGGTQVSEGVVLLGVGLIAFTLIYVVRTTAGVAKGGIIDPLLGLSQGGKEGSEYWTEQLWENPRDWIFNRQPPAPTGAPPQQPKKEYEPELQWKGWNEPIIVPRPTGEPRPRAGIAPGTTTTPSVLEQTGGTGYITGLQFGLDWAEARETEDRWGWGLGPVKGSWGLDW